MKYKLHFFCIMFLFSCSISAQGVQYGGMQQLQFNFGENEANLGLNVVNGIRFGKFFTGIGTDVQFVNHYHDTPFGNGYYRNSIGIPSALFADGRYYINKNKTFFVKLNAGVNLLFKTRYSHYFTEFKRRPGLHSAVGLGLKVALSNHVHYVFDIGYSLRQFRYDISYREPHISEWTHEKHQQVQHFISLNMGIEFY